MSQTTKEYFEKALPKYEKLHRKGDHQKTNIFFENEAATRPRPQRKMINESNKQENDQQKGIKIVSTATPSSDPIKHIIRASAPIQRFSKVRYHLNNM